MKNILIGVLVIGILILGYLFIKQKDKVADTDLGFEFSEETNSSANSTNQNPPITSNPPTTSTPTTPPPTNPNWQSVSSSSAYTLATNSGVYLSPGSSASLSQSVDLNGDGIDEGVFSGDGGNSGITFILIRDVNGQSVVAKQKNKDGTINAVNLLSVGRVMVSEGYKILPLEKGFYTVSKSNDGESGFVCNADGLNAYSWNSATKLFEWNQNMTTRYTAEVCGGNSSNATEYGDDVNGRHVGFIRSVSSSNGNYSLVIDYVILDVCPPINEEDECLINNNPMLRTFTISQNATAKIFNSEWQHVSISLQDFLSGFATGTGVHPNTTSFYDLNSITLQNGVVTEIYPFYIP